VIHFVVLPLTVQLTPVQPLEQLQIPGEVHMPPLKQPCGQYAERTMIRNYTNLLYKYNSTNLHNLEVTLYNHLMTRITQ